MRLDLIRDVFLILTDAAESLERKGGGSLYTESLERTMCRAAVGDEQNLGHSAAPPPTLLQRRPPVWLFSNCEIKNQTSADTGALPASDRNDACRSTIVGPPLKQMGGEMSKSIR